MRALRSFTTVAILASLFSLAHPLWADVCPYPPPPKMGRGPVPGADTQVVLASETVLLLIAKDKVSVGASFTLVNTGPAETLDVGFPKYAPFEKFEAKVDGEPVTPRAVELKKGFRAPGWDVNTRYDGWYVWPMSFDEGQTRTVRVKFRFTPEDETFWIKWPDSSRTSSACWNNPEEGALEDAMTQFWTGYVLRTGAAWKGDIGHAEVRFRFLDTTPEHIRSYRPNARWQWKGNDLIWTKDGFEPDFNLYVRWNPALTLDEEIAAFEKVARPEVSKRDLEYWWRPFHLARLYEQKGGCDDRIEKVFRQVLGRFWPENREMKKPLTFSERQLTSILCALQWLLPYLAKQKDKAAARELAARALPLVEIVKDGGALELHWGRPMDFWKPRERLPLLAKQLAAQCDKILDEN